MPLTKFEGDFRRPLKALEPTQKAARTRKKTLLASLERLPDFREGSPWREMLALGPERVNF